MNVDDSALCAMLGADSLDDKRKIHVAGDTRH